jgi:hypothetical protein
LPPEKEKLLVRLAQRMPDLDRRIWGHIRPDHAGRELRPFAVGADIFGDGYAAVIQCSQITLGVLSEP